MIAHDLWQCKQKKSYKNGPLLSCQHSNISIQIFSIEALKNEFFLAFKWFENILDNCHPSRSTSLINKRWL